MQLVCGTTHGVYALAGGSVAWRSLQDQVITHVAATLHNTVAVAVPAIGPMHGMLGKAIPEDQASRQLPGVHLVDADLATKPAGDGAERPSVQVWRGDARSVGVAPGTGDDLQLFVGESHAAFCPCPATVRAAH